MGSVCERIAFHFGFVGAADAATEKVDSETKIDGLESSGEIDTDLKQAFTEASVRFRKGGDNVSSSIQLLAYGLYKQATIGPCNTKKPGVWDAVGSAKWNAWSQQGNMAKEEAMTLYIKVVDEALNGGDNMLDEEEPDFGSVNVAKAYAKTQSVMAQDVRVVDEEDKTLLHYASENALEKVSSLLESKADVNYSEKKTSEEGQVARQTALILASDLGHLEMVKLLLKKNAQINLQDADGCSALHYAITCEHVEVVKLLLESKADVEIESNDGETPKDLFLDTDEEFQKEVGELS